MTIILSGSGGDRQDLPAVRDRGGETPDTNNPSSPPDAMIGANAADEGLLGLYPYSGCDIKLVVHLPPEDERASSQEILQAEEELAIAQQRLESAPATDTVTQLEAELASLRERLAEDHAMIEDYAGGYVPQPGDPSQAELETEIEDLNGRISSISSQIAQARRAGSREDLEADVAVLTRQLEELRSQTASGTLARTKVLGEIQTLSISDHREKYPVRTLGSVYPRSITRGPRTISGSVVFATFNQHVMAEFLEVTEYRSTGVGDYDRFRYSSYLMDQLPPLDISISFANEYGNLSWMAILGVEFVNEGQVMSVEDLYLEGTAQYVARDFDPIRSVGNRGFRRNRGVGQTLHGTDIMVADLRRRVAHRNIPWV